MEAECSEVTSHGRHPLALSPDAFARGCLFTCFFSVPSLPSQEEDSSICSNCGGCNSVVEVVSSPIAIEVDGGSGGDEDDPPDQTVPINAKMRESPTMISRCNHKPIVPAFYCTPAQLTTDQ